MFFGDDGSPRRLLGVFAHPDDEVFCAGGTVARAAEAGAEIMLLSATRGERGLIKDPAAATRRTLGAVREQELRAAAAELGVEHVQVLDYGDGTLQHHRTSLGAALAGVMRRFEPDAVVTFGLDGGYGHPDHVAISRVTTETFRARAGEHGRDARLYHAVFPPRHTSMAQELMRWMVDSGHRAADRTALHGIALFAAGAATLGLTADDVSVRWFPAGSYVVDEGEPSDVLCLILDGSADALVEQPDRRATCRRLHPGDFFCSSGLAADERTASVVARESLTCLVLARSPLAGFPDRGAPEEITNGESAATTALATCVVDVNAHLHRKLAALARHRTQYPMVPSMLPQRLLEKLLGTEYFRPVSTDSANGTHRCSLGGRTVDGRGKARRRCPAGKVGPAHLGDGRRPASAEATVAVR